MLRKRWQQCGRGRELFITIQHIQYIRLKLPYFFSPRSVGISLLCRSPNIFITIWLTRASHQHRKGPRRRLSQVRPRPDFMRLVHYFVRAGATTSLMIKKNRDWLLADIELFLRTVIRGNRCGFSLKRSQVLESIANNKTLNQNRDFILCGDFCNRLKSAFRSFHALGVSW